jgi:hypothetical protein
VGEEVVAADKVYDAIRSGIRDTDDISFKLLGLVPLVSGVGLLTVVLGDAEPNLSMIVVLSLFGAIVTLGFFFWEIRNVQTCLWLIDYAKVLEQKMLASAGLPTGIAERPKAPRGVGKRTAEKIVYATTVLTWLSVPIAMHALTTDHKVVRCAYIVVSLAVVLFTGKAVMTSQESKVVGAAG